MLRSIRDPDLSGQARHLQKSHAELFEYLQNRDRAIERALSRIPSQADVELGSVFNVRTFLDHTLQGLAPGVGELADGGGDEIPSLQLKD